VHAVSVLTVALLVALNIIFYTCQTFFNKLYSNAYQGAPSAATPVFSLVYGLIVGLSTLACTGFAFAPSQITWTLGLVNGLMLFLFNLGMIQAARTGPYSFQSIIMLFGCVLPPLLFATLVWGDTLSGLQLAGIAFVLVSFVVINCKGLRLKNVKKSFFGWVALVFLTNGLYSIIMDAQQRLAMKTEKTEMIVITFLTSALISVVYLLLTQKGKSLSSFAMGRKAALFAVFSSISAAAAVNMIMYLLGLVQMTVLYAIENGSILVLSILLSAVVLKEKLEKHTLVGIALGLLGIVLLSL